MTGNRDVGWPDVLRAAFRDLSLEIIESPAVWIASDFSDQNNNLQTFAFLIADASRASTWVSKLEAFRQGQHGEIKYSRIKRRKPNSSVKDFVNLSKNLTGYLITISLDATLVALLSSDEQIRNFQNTGLLSSHWKPLILWRSLAIARIGALVFDVLARHDATARWVTDNDAAYQSDEQTKDFHNFITNALPLHRRSNLLEVATTNSDCPDYFLRDLASIADLACGTVHESVRSAEVSIEPVNERDRRLVAWMNDRSSSLRKLRFMFTAGAEQGQLLCSQIEQRLPD